MNPTDKVAIAVEAIRRKGLLDQLCHALSAVSISVAEHPKSAASEELRHHIHSMLTRLGALCADFDNLRSLTGRFEREQGILNPRFYEGEWNNTECGRHCTNPDVT